MEERRKPVPAGEENAEKNRFRKKSKTFQGKGHADDGAGFLHEFGPQQSKLERKDCPRDRTDREENGRSACPTFRELEINWSSGTKIQSLGDRHQHRHSDSHRRENNVET